MNWRKIVVLAFLLGAAACHRKVSVVVPTTPPPAPSPPPAAAVAVVPAALREGDSAYELGDFAQAAKAYESYLEISPQADGADRVWFHFAIAQAMSGTTASVAASSDDFNQLIHYFPLSPYVQPAQMILSDRVDIARLQNEIAQLKKDQEKSGEEIKQLSADLGQSQAETFRIQAEAATKLQAEQKIRDDKIKLLNDELNTIKKLDSERRRTP